VRVEHLVQKEAMLAPQVQAVLPVRLAALQVLVVLGLYLDLVEAYFSPIYFYTSTLTVTH